MDSDKIIQDNDESIVCVKDETSEPLITRAILGCFIVFGMVILFLSFDLFYYYCFRDKCMEIKVISCFPLAGALLFESKSLFCVVISFFFNKQSKLYKVKAFFKNRRYSKTEYYVIVSSLFSAILISLSVFIASFYCNDSFRDGLLDRIHRSFQSLYYITFAFGVSVLGETYADNMGKADRTWTYNHLALIISVLSLLLSAFSK